MKVLRAMCCVRADLVFRGLLLATALTGIRQARQSLMAERYFSLEEAEALIPLLEALLGKAMAGKKSLEAVHSEIAAINEHVTLRGGVLLDLEKNAALKLQKEAAVREVREGVAEMQSAGCLVKDLDLGLVDFPCRVDEGEILLCWRRGEAGIAFWHNTDEGYANRKPVKPEWLRKGRASN